MRKLDLPGAEPLARRLRPSTRLLGAFAAGALGGTPPAVAQVQPADMILHSGRVWTGDTWYTANPLHGVYAAVTRQTIEGTPEGGWFPEERIDVETALRAYTVNNVYVAGEEAYKGKLLPGFVADIAVLERDPFEVDALELKDVAVVLTIVDGEVVFERPRT
jgi:hypothetical protein